MTKIKNKKNGVTLIELMLAVPVFAVVSIAITYVFSSMTQVSTLNRGYLECQIAANNLLTYMEGTGYVAKFNENNTTDAVNGCTGSYGNYILTNNLSPSKDGSFKVELKRSPDDNLENGLRITAITVSKKDTDNSFLIKTYFPNTYYK